jgi:hypothetical protein
MASLLQAGGPTLVSALAGALAGTLVAFVAWRIALALLRWRALRTARVDILLSRGVSRAEIARRTGLSQDAVGMLVRVRTGRSGRRKLPAPARIAALQRDRAHRRNRDWNPQAVAGKGFVSVDGDVPQAARPLPFRIPRNSRFTRSGQTA